MLPQEIIRRKRDRARLSEAELGAFVGGIADGTIGDAQVGAFAMAVFLNGLDVDERVALTRAMRDSGRTLAWPDLDGPVLDKHSTGGVGDTVSLVLGPVVAACGGYVPMISGRGLGHSGGTLDKLESIPGYDATPSLDRFDRVVRDVGVAIVGQTPDLAPADRRLYAIRDVSGTVESIDLITASILSKKLAAGLDALVMDVKVGSGAFTPDIARARDLARSLVDVAGGAGLATVALLTDMNQCLASSAGNAVEVAEAVRLLRGERSSDRLRDVTVALAATLLVAGGLARDDADARTRVDAAIDDGRAAERFSRMVAALGGPTDFVERADAHLPRADVVRPVHVDDDGVVTAIDVRALGLAVVELGGGRTQPTDAIDPAVGLTDVVALGERVDRNRPIATIHARDDDAWQRAATRLIGAIRLGDAPPGRRTPVIERLEAPA